MEIAHLLEFLERDAFIGGAEFCGGQLCPEEQGERGEAAADEDQYLIHGAIPLHG